MTRGAGIKSDKSKPDVKISYLMGEKQDLIEQPFKGSD